MLDVKENDELNRVIWVDPEPETPEEMVELKENLIEFMNEIHSFIGEPEPQKAILVDIVCSPCGPDYSTFERRLINGSLKPNYNVKPTVQNIRRHYNHKLGK